MCFFLTECLRKLANCVELVCVCVCVRICTCMYHCCVCVLGEEGIGGSRWVIPEGKVGL